MPSPLPALVPAIKDAEAETVALLALGSMRGIAYRGLFRIHQAGVPFARIMEQQPEESVRGLLQEAKVKGADVLARTVAAERSAAMRNAEGMLQTLTAQGIRVLYPQGMPESLSRMPDAPGWLFVQGALDVLDAATTAVVGTRTPTSGGRFLAECVCRLFAGSNIATVSGLASGIDEKAHQVSLEIRVPTIAVLGTGIFRDYPAHSRGMRDAIVARGGCIVTEYLPEDGPTKQSFVWRNRIQVGLSDVVVPVEWQLKSGTAHTVNFALERRVPVVGVVARGRRNDTSEFLLERGQAVYELPMESSDLFDCICRIMG